MIIRMGYGYAEKNITFIFECASALRLERCCVEEVSAHWY